MTAYNVVNRAALVAGMPEDVSVILSNLDALATIINGGLDTGNLSPTAAIAASQLAGNIPISALLGYPNDAAKVPLGNNTWGPPPSAVKVGNKVSDLGAGSAGAMGILRLMPTTYNNGGATALPAGTLTVGDTFEFPSAGTFSTPNGDITYTGKTATTFTGCTGGSGTLAANAVITLKTGAPTNNSYPLVSLIYDAVLNKWVSDETSWGGHWMPPTTAASLSTFTEADLAYATGTGGQWDSAAMSPWRAYDAAGLKPQVQVQILLRSSAAMTINVQGSFVGQNVGVVIPSGASAAVGADTASVRQYVYGAVENRAIILPWANLPGSYTLKDYIGPSFQIATSVAANNSAVGRLVMRWVG